MDLNNLNGIQVCKFGETTSTQLAPTNSSLKLSTVEVTPSEELKQIYHCSFCNVDLNSRIVYEQHKKGFKHIKRENYYKLKTNQIPSQNEMQDFTNRGFKCDICNIVLISKLVYEQHVQGQKHLKKVKSIESTNNGNLQLKCEICNIELPNKEQLDIHLSGKKHAKKLKIIEKINDVANSISKTKALKTNSIENKPAPESEQFKCEKCNLTLISKDQLAIHLAGRKHAKKIDENPTSKTTNDQFENLNIAWDKYKIKEELKEKFKGKYDFYCELCNKYMQKKLQLVDHLKSKKHHRRIYERRKELNEKANGKSITFVKQKSSNKPNNIKKLGLKFVSSKNNNNNNNNNVNYKMFNTNVNNMDLNAAFEQPTSENIYSSSKPGYVQYYQPNTTSQILPLMSNQENCPYTKRKYDPSVDNSSIPNYYSQNKYIKNNDSLPIPAYTTTTYDDYNSNLKCFNNTNYESISPVQSNYEQQNQPQLQQDSFKTTKSENSSYQFDMFSNMAFLQYTAAYAAAKQNIK